MPLPGLENASVPALGPQDPVQGELVRVLYGQAPSGLAISAANGLVVALVLSAVSSPLPIWIWFGALVLLLGARALLIARYRRNPEAESPARWVQRFTLGAATTGCAWGLSVLLLPWGELIYHVFLGFVLAGMVAGAVPSLSPAPLAYRLYLVCALAPYVIHLAIIGEPQAYAFLGMTLLYGLFMWLSARRYYATLRHALEVNRANLGLVAELTRERDRIASLNRELEGEVRERRTVQEALVRAKEEAESANVAKSRFVANMSHEIRTPMNGVLGMIEMLGQTNLDAQQRGYLDIARGSAESLLTIINDILDFSKIEAGKLDLESIPFDVRLLAEDVAALFAAGAESKGVELACFVEPRIASQVIGDPTRLRQVLTNVLGNAIKFTQHGEVLVRVGEDARSEGRTTLCFEVSDTGIGMSQSQQQRLFLPFVQADGSTTRRFGGSGLGLAISRNLVQLMGGTVEVESRLAEGSRFRIRIPFAVQAQRRQPAETHRLDGVRMLAVDDHPTNLEILGHYLKGWGVRYEGVPDAAQTLARLRQAAADGDPYALVILDMQMPDMNGLALARAIRKDPAIPRPKLVLLSSGGGPLPGEAQGEMLDLTLSKPVRQALLRDALLQSVHGAVPRAAAPSMTDQQSEMVSLERRLRGRVLLAEDNPINQKVALGMLRKLGIKAQVAGDGAEALERLAKDPFDLVLMDVQMPSMDGFDATRELRRREHTLGLPRVAVVAMTANAMSGDRERCLAAGMDDYLSKPVRLADLRETLGRWLSAVD
jgi:signal transduction histidine kinase/DNA-binding response OmpR family regulator